MGAVPAALCRYEAASGRLVPVGSGAAALLGHVAESVAALGPAQLLELVHRQDRGRLVEALQQVAALGAEDMVGGVLRAWHASGYWRRLRFKAASLRCDPAQSGHAVVVVCLAPDEAGAAGTDKEPGRVAGAAYTLLVELLDHVPEGLTVTGGPPAYRTIVASRHTEQLFGRPVERLSDLVSDHSGFAAGLVCPGSQDRPAHIEQIPAWRALRTGETVHGEEWSIRKPDGSRVAVEVHAVPVREGRRIVAAVSIWREVSERQRVEEALRERSELLGMVVRSTGACLWSYELATHTLVWSEECRALFMWPDEGEPDYERFLASVAEADRERVGRSFAQGFAEAAPFELEFRVSLADGEERWVAAYADCFSDEQGLPLRFFGVMIDVTARHRTQSALLESERRYLELLRSVGAQRSGSGSEK